MGESFFLFSKSAVQFTKSKQHAISSPVAQFRTIPKFEHFSRY